LADNTDSGSRFVTAGWILFLVGCALFVVAGIRSKDLISMIASGLFFLGCVFFLIPLITKR
jgi:uncharacterized membrane protein YtjA (UPF0391 family)